MGGTCGVPCTSVGEENLLMVNDKFHSESILVHEFAHAVMNIGVSPQVVSQFSNPKAIHCVFLFSIDFRYAEHYVIFSIDIRYTLYTL